MVVRNLKNYFDNDDNSNTYDDDDNGSNDNEYDAVDDLLAFFEGGSE